MSGVHLHEINVRVCMSGVHLHEINARVCMSDVHLHKINVRVCMSGVHLHEINARVCMSGVHLHEINARVCMRGCASTRVCGHGGVCICVCVCVCVTVCVRACVCIYHLCVHKVIFPYSQEQNKILSLKTKVMDQISYSTCSPSTDTKPTSPSTDPKIPNVWQNGHFNGNFYITGMTQQGLMHMAIRLSRKVSLSYVHSNSTTTKWSGLWSKFVPKHLGKSPW